MKYPPSSDRKNKKFSADNHLVPVISPVCLIFPAIPHCHVIRELYVHFYSAGAEK